MSALATAAPAGEVPDALDETSGAGDGPVRGRLFEPGGTTLEERISEAWEDLIGEGRTDCPVCSARMVINGGCASCGSELS